MAVRIQVRDKKNLESSLRAFSKMCAREGILKQVKQKAAYEKPSDQRRRRKKEKEKAIRKAERERRNYFQ